MKEKKYNLNIIICLIVFFIISLLSIYSAQNISKNLVNNIFLKQILFYSASIIGLLLSYKYKDFIIKNSILWYIGLNILLLFLLIFGISINGSKCWIFIGPLSLQPSEFMKISIIIVIAQLIYNYDTKKKKSLKNEFILLIKIFIIVIIPSILTFLEPDTGVVIIYFVIMLSMVMYKGINKKWYIITGITIIAIFTIFIIMYLIDNNILVKFLGENIFYRLERILNWSNQSGYQLENSLIAVGSSGLLGFGFNKTPLYFPEAGTDFIFATFASNYGFMGALLLIILVIVFNNTLLSLCNKKINLQDRYIIIGITGMIVYQQVQNISMTIGLLPITGITLPFISYGGCSLLSYMLISGIILRIINDEKKYLN